VDIHSKSDAEVIEEFGKYNARNLRMSKLLEKKKLKED
jgi:hypothetical protein